MSTEVIIGLIAALGGLALYFKSKADKSKVDAILGETKGRDAELKGQQDKVKDEINEVKERDDSKLTPEERADRWNK